MRTIKTQFVQDCAAERVRQNHTALLHKNDTHGVQLSQASTHLHTLAHTRANKAITALGSLPWRIRRRELSAMNEGDNKVRDLLFLNAGHTHTNTNTKHSYTLTHTL